MQFFTVSQAKDQEQMLAARRSYFALSSELSVSEWVPTLAVLQRVHSSGSTGHCCTITIPTRGKPSTTTVTTTPMLLEPASDAISTQISRALVASHRHDDRICQNTSFTSAACMNHQEGVRGGLTIHFDMYHLVNRKADTFRSCSGRRNDSAPE